MFSEIPFLRQNLGFITLLMFILSLCFIISASFANEPVRTLASASSDREKIEFLLNEIENSKAIFIRNGKEHSGKEAAEHLRHKLKIAEKPHLFADNRNVSLEDFINRIAARSSLTHKAYLVREESHEMETRDWLYKKLSKRS